MSLTALLVPFAISLVATAVSPSVARKRLADSQASGVAHIETRFNDADMLMKTLQEHGIPTVEQPDGSIVAELPEGRIVYVRASADEPFVMEVSHVGDIQCLINELGCIENEYNGNVQTYTYERVISRLPKNMVVESEEVMDDNSILLTLTVE